MTKTDSLGHRRYLLGSLRVCRKGKIYKRLELLKMKWELETSKIWVLMLTSNVSETYGSHMQLEKHLASYFLELE